MQLQAVTTLSSGIVVDKNKLSGLKAAEMATTLADVYASGKKVVIVDNSSLFFSPKELIKRLENDGDGWELIAEHFGVTLHPTEVLTLQRASEIRNDLVERVKAIKIPYPFAEVPDGWSVSDKIHVSATGIVRRINGEDDTGYSIGLKTLKTIWDRASKAWLKAPHSAVYVAVRASGYNREAVVRSGQVDIGCQNIKRFELEQFALSQGWEFPEL